MKKGVLSDRHLGQRSPAPDEGWSEVKFAEKKKSGNPIVDMLRHFADRGYFELED